MLVLSRKVNETIVIGENIRITMTAIRSGQVRFAIEAPPDVRILRQELLPDPPEVPSERNGSRASGGRVGRHEFVRLRDGRRYQ